MQAAVISLQTAVTEIFQTVDQHRRDSLDSPFFFIAGAGISYPPIPLATMIESACKEESEKYKLCKDAPLSPLERYSFWFEKAYPDASGRQRYLRIDGECVDFKS